MSSPKSGLLTKIVAVLTLISVAAVSLLGWHWLNGLICHEIRVSGNEQANATEVLAAARVDTGTVLFGIEPALIADRVQRLPWVKSADVTRIPPSTLSIDVEERVPVMLVIDANGIPAAYLDADGYTMPVTKQSTFDLPLLTGARLPQNPNQPVENRAVRELARVIPHIPAATNLLISAFVVEKGGDISLRTPPVNGHGSIAVRLGRHSFDEKLRRLHAFWHAAVIMRPERRYAFIDLRFDSQIVTRETTES